MLSVDLQTPDGRQAAFAAFGSNTFDQLMVKLRQQRAAQIQQLTATVTLEQFNRELWQIWSEVTLREQPITDLSDDLEPDAARVAELAAAADVGELMIHGNNVWRSGSSVFGSGLRTDPSTKESYV